uniref:Peptidase C14 caspase domain-containing protein n=2 Tax=Amphora coffeiformis TaxID=265554 RepID=A0A7S3LF01_9STRA|mmetsp:Transcript_9862/g.18911  ORF Transcript_9862/g.18911 Transcript_9862/m.18911 type:complete len:309 (+) Transcript_9862:101-1027(+)
MSSIDERIKQAIPAEFHMISGSADSQTSADVQNTGKFQLPDPASRAGGACTSALLQVWYRDGHATGEKTWVQCLREMRSNLLQMGFDQVPQLTSSRMIDVNKIMHIVPPGSTGRRRAVLIGINYVGQQGQLSGCHNDVNNIKKYLIAAQGFKESEMLILMDDGRHHAPTRKNIEDAFRRITEYSNAGDVVFVHYSGHGGRVRDTSGDEEDGYDETLIPVDFRSAGQIVDDNILDMLVKPMRAGVTVTVLMDCCHSGTVLDLPYRFSADDSQMRLDQGMNMDNFLGKLDPGSVALCACLGFMMMNMLDF